LQTGGTELRQQNVADKSKKSLASLRVWRDCPWCQRCVLSYRRQNFGGLSEVIRPRGEYVRRAIACAVLVAAGLDFGSVAGLAQTGPAGGSALDGAALFRQQCATCHTLSASDPPRQGPTLAGVYGRKPGSVAGFHYSPGYAKADFVWDDTHLDAYLTNPQAVIPGSIMPYRQARAPVRQAIIAFLKEQH